MDNQQAMTYLTRLADGIDPVTGEVFDRNSPYQRAETVRALYAAINAMRSPAEKPRPASSRYPRSGQPWTSEEEHRIVEAFESGKTPGDMVQEIGRSEIAIAARLVKLGKMEAPPNLRFHEPDRRQSA